MEPARSGSPPIVRRGRAVGRAAVRAFLHRPPCCLYWTTLRVAQSLAHPRAPLVHWPSRVYGPAPDRRRNSRDAVSNGKSALAQKGGRGDVASARPACEPKQTYKLHEQLCADVQTTQPPVCQFGAPEDTARYGAGEASGLPFSTT